MEKLSDKPDPGCLGSHVARGPTAQKNRKQGDKGQGGALQNPSL
jgi:hypothetical protein